MATAKVKLPDFRISLAAVGRRLSSVMLRANSGELSREEFMDTINAVFERCVFEETVSDPEAHVDAEILAAEQAEIEKSVRRSQAARKAAARRRRQKNVPVSEWPAGTLQDMSDSLPAVIVQTGEQSHESRDYYQDITDSSEEDPLDEPDEIFVRKYDAYGARIRPY